jgi:hypothetical protein
VTQIGDRHLTKIVLVAFEPDASIKNPGGQVQFIALQRRQDELYG